MPQNFVIGVKIAATAGAAIGVIGGVNNTIKGLEKTVTRLQIKKTRLDEVMEKYPGSKKIAGLKLSYESLSKSIEKVKNKQLALNTAVNRGQELKDQRSISKLPVRQ